MKIKRIAVLFLCLAVLLVFTCTALASNPTPKCPPRNPHCKPTATAQPTFTPMATRTAPPVTPTRTPTRTPGLICTTLPDGNVYCRAIR